MSTKFQKGQRIRYIEDTNTLKKGSVYTVSGRASGDNGVTLEGFGNRWWFDKRFELEEPEPILVRTKEQVQADRRTELLNGVVAYHTQGKEVPKEWIEELYYNVGRG